MGHRHRDQLGEPGHDLDRFQGCVLGEGGGGLMRGGGSTGTWTRQDDGGGM
jgi:hypothetical protein